MLKRAAIFVAAVLLAAGAAWAQEPAGPMQTPTNPPVIKRIPLYPKVPPPPMSPEQIVSHFLANETAYKDAYEKYGFLQTIRVEELGSNSEPTGSYQVETEVLAKSGGDRYERLLTESKSTLQVLSLSSQDLETIAAMPPFPLAGDVASKYNFTYRGTEKQGELMTYAFQVEPKVMEFGQIYFSGVVWVDELDLAIVKSYGHFVSNGPQPAHALPFSFYDTYRGNIEGKYWFPIYIRSDDYFEQGNNELPIRLIVRSSDYHLGQPRIPPANTQ